MWSFQVLEMIPEEEGEGIVDLLEVTQPLPIPLHPKMNIHVEEDGGQLERMI